MAKNTALVRPNIAPKRFTYILADIGMYGMYIYIILHLHTDDLGWYWLKVLMSLFLQEHTSFFLTSAARQSRKKHVSSSICSFVPKWSAPKISWLVIMFLLKLPYRWGPIPHVLTSPALPPPLGGHKWASEPKALRELLFEHQKHGKFINKPRGFKLYPLVN